MATLKPFLGPTGGSMKVWLYGLINNYVGSGNFTEATDFKASFSGNYDYLGFKGAVTVALELKDHNANAPSGPCSITIMQKRDDSATYAVQGGKMVVTTTLNANPIEIYQYKGGSEFDKPTLPVVGSLGVWIGP